MNYIKDIQLKNNNSYNIIVEIPKGTKNKYELDEKTFDKVICVRKIKYKYPFYYGCFPQTFAGDKDPLDMILITHKKYKPLDIVQAYPVTTIKTLDCGEQDDKVIMLDDSYKVDGKKLEKIIKQILKFLSIYKGKNADMIIDKNYYGIKESLEIIDKAHNEYLNRNKINGIKVIFN